MQSPPVSGDAMPVHRQADEAKVESPKSELGDLPGSDPMMMVDDGRYNELSADRKEQEDDSKLEDDIVDASMGQQQDEDDEEEPRDFAARANGRDEASDEDEQDGDDEDADDRPRRPSDDEDDEDEEEDGAEETEGRPRKKRRKRKEGASRYLDLEVEVDTDEEEEEEDDDGIQEGFIVDRERRGSGEIDEDEYDEEDDRNDAGHRDLERRRREFEDKRAEDLARELDERNRERRQRLREAQAMGDSGLPRNALMPDVNDPTIWGLKVKRGRERDIVLSIFRKVTASGGAQIISAFARDTIEGYVYVEARSEAAVRSATYGIIGVYANNNLLLVPLEQRADLLKTKKKEFNLQPNGWVRLKRGKYAGDLAQIVDVDESGQELTLKYIPRIDFLPREESNYVGSDGRKRKKGGNTALGFRPPPAFFNAEVVKRAFGNKSVTYANREYHFAGDDYRDGYLLKEHKLAQVEVENINPTIDEVTRFASGGKARDENGGDEAPVGTGPGVDYQMIADAQRKAANVLLQPGDLVEIFEGDQKGIIGLVESISEGIVTLAPSPAHHPNLANTKIDISMASVRKRFNVGDHIKVMAGANLDESGLITFVEGDIVTFLSDLSQQQVQVFSKDVREAAEVGAGVNAVGEYELHDLVLLDQSTAGVIFKTEREMFRVLDQTGSVRTVRPAQITGKVDSSRSIAADSEGVDIRSGDMVKETTSNMRGEGRTGRVLHVYRSLFAFLHNRDLAENGGIFVVNVRYLSSLQPKSLAKQGAPDLSKMNPNLASGMAPPPLPIANAGSGKARDPIEGLRDVYIKVGPYKGHKGIIKDANGLLVRIELETSSKLVTIERNKLLKEDRNGQKIDIDRFIIEQRGGPMRAMNAPNQYAPTQNPYGGIGSLQPNGNSRTPNPYAASSSSRTPNPYASAAAGGGRTPNPYAAASAAGSGRTPNPFASNVGGKTPNPYASNVGGKTPNPYAAGLGGKTPNPYLDGGATPARRDENDPWNATSSGSSGSSAWDANAKTPYTSNEDRAGGFYSGGTPQVNAPTPAATGTGAYGSFQRDTPRSGATPRETYAGRSSYDGRQDDRSSQASGDRFGTATNTSPLGAPSRYGSRGDGDAPTPRGAPTPAQRDYRDHDTPYGAPTPAARGAYSAPTPGTRYDSAATPGNEYYGTPGPVGAPTPAPSSYQRETYDRAMDRPTPSGDYRTPAPRGAPTPSASYGLTPGASYGTPRDYSAPTPAPAHGPTPGSYGGGAPTPAPAGAETASGSASGSQPAFVPPDWPEVGLEVMIVRDASTMASFAGARFDDSRAVITSVPPHRPYEQNIVNVRLASTDEVAAPNVTLPPVPINFLEVITPTESGQRAMVIGTGKLRREIVTCKSLDEGSWLVGLADGRQSVIEQKLLCVYAQ